MQEVHILSTDTPIDDFENLFTSLEYAMEALIGLRERVIEAEDIKLADDAGSIMSLYIEYTKQLIAKGRDLTQAQQLAVKTKGRGAKAAKLS